MYKNNGASAHPTSIHLLASMPGGNKKHEVKKKPFPSPFPHRLPARLRSRSHSLAFAIRSVYTEQSIHFHLLHEQCFLIKACVRSAITASYSVPTKKNQNKKEPAKKNQNKKSPRHIPSLQRQRKRERSRVVRMPSLLHYCISVFAKWEYWHDCVGDIIFLACFE